MFLLIFLLLAITSNIPFPARPELNFLRLLGRYFRSCEYLMFTMHQNPQRKETRFERWKRIFYRYEMSSLPSKLGTWARFIDKEALSGATPQQVQAVLTSLQALSYRMAELLAERGSPQASFLVQELLLDVRAWHVKVQKSFQRLIENPAAGEEEKFRAGLAHILNHLEQRIEETLNKSVKKELSDLDGISFYRLLGAYRGVSEALVAYAGCAHTIDWARWREERF
jgi:hypothetical protein